MELSEISAVLGIDVEAADREKLLERALEFCYEMADCYEEGSVERNAFEALSFPIFRACLRDRVGEEA